MNAILPGLMKTPMVEHSAGLAASYAKGDVEAMWRARDAQVPMGHMGDAWDVANAALFLASDESKYVTGMELVVDGGDDAEGELSRVPPLRASSLRTQGPIRRGLQFRQVMSNGIATQTRRLRRMGPCFRRDDDRYCSRRNFSMTIHTIGVP